MAAFVGSRVKEALWPEFLGMMAYAGGELALANLDAAIATKVNGYPVAQTAGTAAAIIGSVVAIGQNKATDFSKGVLYGSIVGIVVNLVRSLWEMAKNTTTQTAISDIAALIPRRVTPALTSAQQQALLNARSRVTARTPMPAAAGAGVVGFQYE
jgi:hypothetical protein